MAYTSLSLALIGAIQLAWPLSLFGQSARGGTSRFERNMVSVVCGGSQAVDGVGIIVSTVDKSKYVATALHNLREGGGKCGKITVKYQGKQVQNPQIRDEEDDMLDLGVIELSPQAFPWRDKSVFPPKQILKPANFPASVVGPNQKFYPGKITQWVDKTYCPKCLEYYNPDIKTGFSGSPIVDKQLGIFGMVVEASNVQPVHQPSMKEIYYKFDQWGFIEPKHTLSKTVKIAVAVTVAVGIGVGVYLGTRGGPPPPQPNAITVSFGGSTFVNP